MVTLRLGDLAKIKRGVSYNSESDLRDQDGSDTVRLLRSTNIQGGRVVLDDVHIIDAACASEADLLQPGDLAVCIANGSRDLVGKAALVPDDLKGPYVVGAFCARLRAREGESAELLAALLESLPYRKWIGTLLAGTNIGNIRPDDILACPLQVPSNAADRVAFGAMLKKCRKVLEGFHSLIAAKRAFKRALLHQLLQRRRRFPEFAGSPAWQQMELGDLVESVTRRNTVGATERVLTCSGEHGLVDQRQFFSKLVAGESREGYFRLQRGEFAYNRSSMSGYPYGATKRLDRYESGVVSTLNICFALTSDACTSDFLLHLFESGLLNQQLGRIARVGSRAHGLLNVTKSEFFQIKLLLPSIAEQERITSVLNALDREIGHLEELRVAHEVQKRALMHRLLTGELKLPATSADPQLAHA